MLAIVIYYKLWGNAIFRFSTFEQLVSYSVTIFHHVKSRFSCILQFLF